jgi:hypothetical protein
MLILLFLKVEEVGLPVYAGAGFCRRHLRLTVTRAGSRPTRAVLYRKIFAERL